MSRGQASDASVAGPPSPEKPGGAVAGDRLDRVGREVDPTDALVLGVRDVEAILVVDRQRAARLGVVVHHLEGQQRRCGRAAVAREARLGRRRRRCSITPSLPMRRTRKLRVSAR